MRWDMGIAFRSQDGWLVYLYTCGVCAALVAEGSLDVHEAYHEKKGDYPK